MYIVIVNSVSSSNFFFGPFPDKDEADNWAREYSIQNSCPVEVVMLLQAFDLLAGTEKVCRVPVLTDKGDEWIDIIHDNWDKALQIARERGYTLNEKHL